MNIRVAYTIALMFLLSAPLYAVSQTSTCESRLREAERRTQMLLDSDDYDAVRYALPSWAASMEGLVGCGCADTLDVWCPDGLTAVGVADTLRLWYGSWCGSRGSLLVWAACRRETDGSVSVMAFADEACPAASAAVECHNYGAAWRLALTDTMRHESLLNVADAACRMDLRLMTDRKSSDAMKREAEQRLKTFMDNAPQTLCGSLDGMPELTVCDASDGRIRIVTYMVVEGGFRSRCGGWVVAKNKQGIEGLWQLTDATADIGQPEQAVLNNKKWYGALYSDIIPFRCNKRDYYALIGFKGADATVKTRVIDVMSVDDASIIFGAKLFLHPKSACCRRVFQYSARAAMQIRYDSRNEMIVMDHLAPNDPLFAGRAMYYGPDLTYDGYLLTKEGWRFQNNIDVTIEKGAQPNDDEETVMPQTQPDSYGQPAHRNTSRGGSSVKQDSRNNGSWSGSKQQPSGSWFDKGRGSSAPNVRKKQ